MKSKICYSLIPLLLAAGALQPGFAQTQTGSDSINPNLKTASVETSPKTSLISILEQATIDEINLAPGHPIRVHQVSRGVQETLPWPGDPLSGRTRAG